MNKKEKPSSLGVERVFLSSFSNVWRAVQLSLAEYPLEINDTDKGELQTDRVSFNQIWKAPSSVNFQFSVGSHYKLKILLFKGQLNGKQAVRVKIQKIIKRQKDFFSGYEELESDGFEEKALLYRIGREITIETGLKRVYKKRMKEKENSSVDANTGTDGFKD